MHGLRKKFIGLRRAPARARPAAEGFMRLVTARVRVTAPPTAGWRGADEWFGQPRGLSILFLTEMWMQFSFFGMRTILVYYMTKELLIPQGRSSLIYGSYAAAVYFTPIFGGFIADRWLGKRTSVVHRRRCSWRPAIS